MFLPYSRFRERDTSKGTVSYTVPAGTEFGDCTNVWSPYPSSAYVYEVPITLSEKMYDSETSNFKRRLQQGQIVPTRAVYHVRNLGYSEISYLEDYTMVGGLRCCSGVKVPTGFHFYKPISVPANYGHAVDDQVAAAQAPQALKSAIAQCRDAELDLLTTWGERKETIEHIAKRLKDVAGLTSNFKSTLKRLKRTESIHGAWLEYRYAVMPNVYTIQSLVKVLNEPNMTRAKGFGDISWTAEKALPIAGPYGTSYEAQVSTDVSVRGHALAQATLDSLGTHFKVNPLTTAWELTRLSFVVDWFIDVGDTLASYRMPWESKIVNSGYSVSLKTYVTYPTFLEGEDAVNYGTRTCADGNWQHSVTYKKTWELQTTQPLYAETYFRSYLAPDKAAYWPRFRVELNPERLLDAVALLRGFTRR